MIFSHVLYRLSYLGTASSVGDTGVGRWAANADDRSRYARSHALRNLDRPPAAGSYFKRHLKTLRSVPRRGQAACRVPAGEVSM